MTRCTFSDEQHLAVREMVRAFARDEVAPVAKRLDDSQEFPWENVRKMGELGLLGIPWPEELGGAGLDIISFIDRDRGARARRRVALDHDLGAHDARHLADRELRHARRRSERYVPLLASGRVIGGFGLTEDTAGSDAGGTRTTAVSKNGRYVLNGSKRFITHAGVGEIFVVTAVTDPAAGTRGISAFILTKETCDLAARDASGRRATRPT